MALSIEQELFHPLNGWVFHSDLRLKSAESESLLKSCAVPSAEVNVRLERGNLDRLRTLGGSGVNKTLLHSRKSCWLFKSQSPRKTIHCGL